MAKTSEIIDFLNTSLEIGAFKDVSLNGLQIQGSPETQNLSVAVDAGLEVVQEALRQKSHMLIVHHGLFWGKPLAVVGPHQSLLKSAFDGGLNLYAAHLPLDAHPSLGNNALLAELLELENVFQCVEYAGGLIGAMGENAKGRSLSEMAAILSKLPGAQSNPLSLPFGPKNPKNVLIISGSAADTLYEYAELGFDTFITGEPKQFAYHFAKERGLNVIFGGHYATETVGVRKLGEVLAGKFGVSSSFIDRPTGI